MIEPMTHIDGEATRVSGVRVPAWAHLPSLRPGAMLGPQVHIGNFVEVKTARWGTVPKPTTWPTRAMPAWASVNYGAGAIAANHDGANKHRTVIGDDVHVGSNAVLAPVSPGRGRHSGRGLCHQQRHARWGLERDRARQTIRAVGSDRKPPAK